MALIPPGWQSNACICGFRRHRLVSAQRLLWIGEQCLSLYRFRHHLFQKYLDQSLDAVERARLHAQVGSMLETLYATQRTTYAVQLARHFAAAEMLEKAVDYLHQAGEHAHQLAANVKAIEHMRHGLALLTTLPDTPRRAGRELALQILRGNALIAVQGYAASAVIVFGIVLIMLGFRLRGLRDRVDGCMATNLMR